VAVLTAAKRAIMKSSRQKSGSYENVAVLTAAKRAIMKNQTGKNGR